MLKVYQGCTLNILKLGYIFCDDHIITTVNTLSLVLLYDLEYLAHVDNRCVQFAGVKLNNKKISPKVSLVKFYRKHSWCLSSSLVLDETSGTNFDLRSLGCLSGTCCTQQTATRISH